MSGHYHVFAVQDLGGSQESWTGWDDQFTAAEANQHLNDIVRADVMSQNGHAAEARAEFSERYSDLVSDNVAPGWDRVIAVCCAEPCRFGELFAEIRLVRGAGGYDVLTEVNPRHAGPREREKCPF